MKQGDSIEMSPTPTLGGSQEGRSPRIFPKVSLHPHPKSGCRADLRNGPIVQI